VTFVHHSQLAAGDPGTLETLRVMARLVNGRGGVDNPSVVFVARSLVADTPRSDSERAAVIRDFLQRIWKFVDDPPDRELLRDPENMMHEYDATGAVMGDCDEAAILGAALGKAAGLDATFTVLGWDDASSSMPGQPPRYSHVFASLLTRDGAPVDLDVTKPAGPVPAATRELTVSV
jgi:hypothetical protein